MEGKRSKLQGLRRDLNRKIDLYREQLLIYGLIGVAVISGLAFLYTGPLEISHDGDNRNVDIEGEKVNVNVDGERAEPFRPVISPEDGIRFTNSADHRLEFEFDRHVDSFSLQSGESRVVDLNMTVYYNVTASGKEEFRPILAGISVQ
ncbi:MAG: hypothetical protein BRC27_01450 [Nanohaloarchaea archaeon SW_10_44_10]|nr:MAG: hypothetical protein BRC27_01450 [Nanohaloarchaea archaeon SW_10_44_10]